MRIVNCLATDELSLDVHAERKHTGYLEWPICKFKANSEDSLNTHLSIFNVKIAKKKKMFQMDVNFLSHKNIFWFLMMMKKYFLNINLFSFTCILNLKMVMKKEKFQVAGNGIKFELHCIDKISQMKLFHEAGYSGHINSIC